MRIKRRLVILCSLLMLSLGTTAYCTDLDSISSSQGQGQVQSTQGQQQQEPRNTGDESFDSITGYMKGYKPVTQEDMAKASALTSPISSLIGKAIGIIVLLTVALIFLVTAFDIVYISVPFMRKVLNPAGEMQGGMGGQQQQSGLRLVSDEAVQALAQGGQQSGGQSSFGGMQGGFGGMQGGFGQGGMSPSQQPSGGKIVILAYLKKRLIFFIIFAIASTILLSSLILDCGLNLAQLLYKIGTLINNGISNVQIG